MSSLRGEHTMRLPVVIIFFVACFARDVSPFCGDRKQTGDLARAAVRAAEWTRANLRISTTEGHILASAVHSLRLVGHSLNTTSDEISARLKSEIDTAGLMNIHTGRVAQYIHGIYSICQDPRVFQNYNLFKTLKRGTAKFPRYGFNHYFQYGTAVLGLCVSGYTHSKYITEPLVNKMMSWTKGKKYASADTVAMATMALACVYEGRNSEANSRKRRIRQALKRATNWLTSKKRQQKEGVFGNSITTALVSQALLSARDIVGPYKRRWDCAVSMRHLLKQQQNDGSYGDLMSTVQVMPVLIGAIPSDLKKLKCHKKSKKRTIINICVRYEFQDNTLNALESQPPPPVYMNVTSGTSAHKLLRLAAELDQRYQFTTRRSSYGFMITSINGVKENEKAKKHWMVFSAPNKMAPSGIDTYRPQHNTCVIFRFMKT